jgi:hypothetical protein
VQTFLSKKFPALAEIVLVSSQRELMEGAIIPARASEPQSCRLFRWRTPISMTIASRIALSLDKD